MNQAPENEPLKNDVEVVEVSPEISARSVEQLREDKVKILEQIKNVKDKMSSLRAEDPKDFEMFKTFNTALKNWENTLKQVELSIEIKDSETLMAGNDKFTILPEEPGRVAPDESKEVWTSAEGQLQALRTELLTVGASSEKGAQILTKIKELEEEIDRRPKGVKLPEDTSVWAGRS